MKKVISDGWHNIGKESVYTENGIILRATKTSKNGDSVPAAIYKAVRDKTGFYLVNVTPCKYSTFRNALRRGTGYYIE